MRALELAGAPHPVAEDLAQEAFARMLTHWRRVRTGSNPAGYAYRTGFRLLNRSRRSRTALGAVTGSAPPISGAAQLAHDRPEAGTDEHRVVGPEAAVTTRVAIVATLATMPARRRACAVMCLVVGLPTSEAATALGITEGTVRKHLGEARQDLRRALDA